MNGNSLALRYEGHLRERPLLIAAQTVAELRYGAFKAKWGENRWARLELMLGRYAVVYPNDQICTLWAFARSFSDGIGRGMGEGDAWIAATALVFDIPLVTHNRRHFDFIENLTLISENPA
jgi:predicted nucleic acid-binding protein